MLFVPPGIPFMIPEAEAAHSSNLQGAITDLSLVSVVDYNPQFSSALRNKITLSWSAPNDNGSPITYYVVQAKGTSGNWVKLDHMEPTVTTYTHTTVVNVQIQYRVWAVGPDGCHGNTTTYYDTLPCNEGNILSVVSVYGGGIYPPIPQCDNEFLDDCGYFDVDLTAEGDVVAQPANNAPAFTRGEANALITGTVKIINQGAGTALVDAHLLVTRSDGTVWHDANVINDETLGGTGSGSAMSQGWGWNESILSNYPLGAYTYTFTIDPANTVAETNENNNVYTGTFTVAAPADTTPPVITTTNIAMNIANSTGIPNLYYDLPPANDIITNSTGTHSLPLTPTCIPPPGSSFPVGTTTVTCTATDAAGNPGTGTFTVTLTDTGPTDTTPPVVTVPSNYTNSTSVPTGKTITWGVTAADNVGVTSGPTCSPSSGSNFSVGTTTVTCTASDAAGNTGTASFTVTVVFDAGAADTTPPVVTVPADINLSTTNSQGWAHNLDYSWDSSGPQATDDVGGNFFFM